MMQWQATTVRSRVEAHILWAPPNLGCSRPIALSNMRPWEAHLGRFVQRVGAQQAKAADVLRRGQRGRHRALLAPLGQHGAVLRHARYDVLGDARLRLHAGPRLSAGPPAVQDFCRAQGFCFPKHRVSKHRLQLYTNSRHN